MALTKEQIREKLANRKKRVVPFEGTLPDLEELTGSLALMELSAADTRAIKIIATTEDGYDDALDIGATVARSLVTLGKERIYDDLESGEIAEYGLSVTMPLVSKIKEISGLATFTPVADAKKNSSMTQTNDSQSLSGETPVQPETAEPSTNS